MNTTLMRLDRSAGRTIPTFDRGPEWMFDDRRNCKPKYRHRLFYSHLDTEQDRARGFCGTCPFTTKCLAYALSENERHGMWGGVLMSSPAERDAAAQRLEQMSAS